MTKRLQFVPLALSILLAACATAPSQMPHKPVAITAPPVTIENGIAPHAELVVAAPQTSDFWDQLRGSFGMTDCDADPSVLAWAKRYTHNPEQFESQLREALPRLTYVKEVAAHYDVAGEFVLLPWIESYFQPVPGRKNRPAGMWQIMPATAGSIGLRVDGHYDGRLDVDASANAVMKLLKQYHDEFHDWRVVDYAYNAGEFNISKLVRTRGTPPDEPVIPKWPVRSVTREHLTKLLAMACVVREPARFGVSLPTLSNEQHLVQVKISHSMPMTQAADHAGISVDSMKSLNSAFRSDMVDADATSYLLLPASHVQQFRDALLDQSSLATADSRLTTSVGSSAALSVPATNSPTATAPAKTHTVKAGESLWQIAHLYSVNIAQLQRLNHLHGQQPLKPGQVLVVSGAN
jgi:membrane-bound lytic murein transglycosylase D